MKRLLFCKLLCLAIVVSLLACDDNSSDWTQPYDLAYRYDTSLSISVGKSMTFTDLSLGVATREWIFQDATPAISNAPEPAVVFNSKGVKTVSLTVNYNNGKSETTSFDVEVFYPLTGRIASRSLTAKGCLRLDTAIEFGLDDIEGDPNVYAWTFEGGTPATSTERNPVVTWSDPNPKGAKITCRMTRTEDNMVTNLETSYIVGNYPMLYALPEKQYDPWEFELTSFGKWTLWNTAAGSDDVGANASIVAGGANGTAHALKVAFGANIAYQFFTRDNWACNAQLTPGCRYEVKFWQKADFVGNAPTIQLGIYNSLPGWSWNEMLGVLASQHWSQYFPDISFEEQTESLLCMWAPFEDETMQQAASLIPSATWQQVCVEFVAPASNYRQLLNSYPYFYFVPKDSEFTWYIDQMQINLVEE